MKGGIFVDTGAWYALVDRSDPIHHGAAAFFGRNRRPLMQRTNLAAAFAFDRDFEQYGFTVLPA